MSPNIVFITTHDLGKHLNLYGVNTVNSPHLDALAAESVLFGHHFCTAPQCSPSRATLHTGRYAHSVGMLGLAHEPFNWRLHADEQHIAQRLRNAGYQTALVGIQHLTEGPFQLENPDELGYDQALPAQPAPQMIPEAITLMGEMAAQEAPFYLEIGFFETHREYNWGGAVPDETGGIYLPPYITESDGAREDFAALQGMVKVMDEGVGQIVSALEALNLYDDTLLIFTTDHGIAMPRAKCTLYDPGIEVALLMHWGKFTPQRINATTSHVDIVPTLLQALGIDIPEHLHGHSLLPLIHGEASSIRDVIFTEKTYHTAYEPMRSIRTHDHKLIVNFTEDVAVNVPADIQNSPTYPPMIPITSPQRPDYELYDLKNDPNERNNLAQNAQYADVMRDLSRQLFEWMEQTDDPLLDGVPMSPHHQRMIRLLREGSN